MADNPLEPPQPQQMMQPQQSGTDWTTLATALIPAALGMLVSGGSPAAGLAGLAGGAGQIVDDRRDTLKLNNEVAVRQHQMNIANEQVRMEQQRNTISERTLQQQIVSDKATQERMEKLAVDQLQNSEIERKKNTIELDRAMRSDAARGELRKTITDPKKAALFDFSPEAWQKLETEEKTQKGLRDTLKALNIKNVAAVDNMPIDIAKSIIEEEIKARNQPAREIYSLQIAPDGTAYAFNRVTGKIDKSVAPVPGGGKVTSDKDAELMLKATDQAWKLVLDSYKTGPMQQLELDNVGSKKDPKTGKLLPASDAERQIELRRRVTETEREIVTKWGRPDLYQAVHNKAMSDLKVQMTEGKIQDKLAAMTYLVKTWGINQSAARTLVNTIDDEPAAPAPQAAQPTARAMPPAPGKP